ncbi:MAG: porin family protein [Bacteroidota bacterium]
MKKQILLVVFSATSFLGFAQVKPVFKISAGVSSSSIQGDAADQLNNILDYTNGMITTNSSIGFYAGASAGIPISKMVSIEPGLYYTQKGYEMKGQLNLKGLDFLGASAKAKLQMQYIDIPILLKVNMNGFQVFAGPQVSYLTQADLKTTAGVFGINLLNKKMDATDQLNRWDMGVTGGVGYQFNNGLNISASYDRGLSNVDANKNFNSYNQTFRVGIGYNF